MTTEPPAPDEEPEPNPDGPTELVETDSGELVERLSTGTATLLLVWLVVIGAGTALLGILLSPGVSGVATEAVLTGAGRTQDVVVTVVAYEPTDSPAYYCSVRHQDGSPVGARLWRGCGPSVAPGDLIGMVYDPAGRVAPRGIEGPGALLWGLVRTAMLLLAFAAVCFVAVVRSYRVPPSAQRATRRPRSRGSRMGSSRSLASFVRSREVYQPGPGRESQSAGPAGGLPAPPRQIRITRSPTRPWPSPGPALPGRPHPRPLPHSLSTVPRHQPPSRAPQRRTPHPIAP